MRYKYFLIFVVIGVTCVGADYILYRMFLVLHIHMAVSKALSSVFSVFLNYILNAKFNFGNKKMSINLLLYYYILYFFLICINSFVNYVFYLVYNDLTMAFLIATVLSVFLNYIAVETFFRKVNNDSKT